MNGGGLYFMRVTHDSITIYTIIIVHSSFFSLVKSHAQLENTRTAEVISVTSQSKLFENFENGGGLYFMRVTHDSITIYTIIIVHSSFFSLVKSHAQLENTRTAEVISVTSQSQLFENFEQLIALFVLYVS